MAEVILAALPRSLRDLLPKGCASLAALHDLGKITVGFQAKCSAWIHQGGLPNISIGEAALSVSDHALVSQVFLQNRLAPTKSQLWAMAVGAHHGRPKGRNASLRTPECRGEWAGEERLGLAEELLAAFGALPAKPPDERLKPFHSDLWMLAGLITVADWIGSNETWFSPQSGLPLDQARQRACEALGQIGWPGGTLRSTDFPAAFREDSLPLFQPNPVQRAVAEGAQHPGIIIVEGPMGCGKTEAALFAAQQLIAAGSQHGIYFALPTQVTSNRIHQRVAGFLRNTLADRAALRLAHGHAWMEDGFDLRITPAYPARGQEEQ